MATNSQGWTVFETTGWLSDTSNNSQGWTVFETTGWLSDTSNNSQGWTVFETTGWLSDTSNNSQGWTVFETTGWLSDTSNNSQGWTVSETTGWLSDTSNHLLKETEFEISCSGTVCLMVDLFCLCNLFVNLWRQPVSMCVCSKSGANKWQNTERQNFWISIERTYTVLISFSESCQNTTFYLWT